MSNLLIYMCVYTNVEMAILYGRFAVAPKKTTREFKLLLIIAFTSAFSLLILTARIAMRSWHFPSKYSTIIFVTLIGLCVPVCNVSLMILMAFTRTH